MRTPVRSERGAAGVKFAIVFVLLAAVLAVAFYGTDAYAHRRVESEAVTQLQGELGTPGPPTVEIAGRPFLTQVVGRKIGEVHVVADGVGQQNDAALTIAHVDLTLHDVTTTDWWQTMTAARAEGTARIDHEALKKAAGLPLTYAGGGRYTLDANQSLYGLTVEAKVTGRLALDVDQQSVSLADPTVQVAGYTLPDVVANQLIKAIVRPIPLAGIPLDLQVTSLDAQDDGLHVGLNGTDVPLTR